MGKRQLLLMGLLSNLVAFLVIFNISSFVVALGNSRLNLIYLLLAIPFAFMFFLRKNIKKMRYFLLIHFAMLIPPLATWHDMWIFIPLISFVIVMILYSIRRKSEGEWEMNGYTAAWVIAVLVVLSLLYAINLPDISEVGVLLNISSLISLAAIVLYMYLNNMQYNLDLIGTSHQGNSVQAASVSNVLVAAFLIILTIFAALSVLFPSEAVVLVILRLFLDVIPLVFQFIGFILRGVTAEPGAFGDITITGLTLAEALRIGPDQIPEPSLFLTIIHAISRFLIVFVLVAAAITFTITFFYKLYKAFRMKERPERQSLMPDDTVNKLKFVLGDVKDLLPRFKINSKHPVRRAYIKKINSHIKQGFEVRQHYTPEVIADKIRPKEDIDELTRKYEEVRYGRL